MRRKALRVKWLTSAISCASAWDKSCLPHRKAESSLKGGGGPLPSFLLARDQVLHMIPNHKPRTLPFRMSERTHWTVLSRRRSQDGP